MQILICDDDTRMAAQIADTVSAHITSHGIAAQIDVLSSEEDLRQISCGYDLAFLDVDMGAINGIDTARQLKIHCADAVIVFVTNYIEYAPSGYEVNAFRYILKAELDKKLPEVIELALEEYKKRHRVVSFSVDSEAIDVPAENILYLESDRRMMVMHLLEGERDQYRFYATMAQMEATLSPIGFLRIHKSYLVNMDYIKLFRYGKVRLKDSTELPCSKSKYSELKQKYLAWRGGHKWNIG